MAVFQQMIIFVILMAVGAVARRCGILTPENQPQLTKLVVNVAYPAIILSGVTGEGARIGGSELLTACAVILGMLALLLVCARILPKLMGYPEGQQGAVDVMFVFTNIGFMGVPMIDSLYGKDALIYMTVLLIPFNLLFYSYVQLRLRGTKGENAFTLRSLLNPGMAACVLAIVLYVADVRLPYVVSAPIRMLGSMTAPLAMMLLGSFLLETRWRTLLSVRGFVFAAVKMLALPIAITLALRLVTDNTYLLAVCMAALATPSGNVIPLLAALYNKEAYPVTVEGVAITTAVSVVTMPLVAMAAGLG
jgi:predicted permease